MEYFTRSIHGFAVARSAMALLLIILAPSTWAVACDAIFTNGVQSHSSTGNVSLDFQTTIGGGDNVLDTPSLIVEQEVTCGGATCTDSGIPAASSSPDFVRGTGSDGDISGGGNINVDSGDYRSVEVSQQRRLRFRSAGGQYLMESLTTNFQSELELSSGDYWIDGDLVIGQETEISPRGGGTVRIFVDGNVSLGFQVETSGFSADRLLIYATGNISLANEVELEAFLYAGGTFSAGFQSQVSGGLSASQVNLDNENEITYSASALVAADFAPFCSDAAGGEAGLEAYWAMDEASWSGTSGEVVDQSGNGNHGTARNGADTESASPALAGDPGTCGYGQFDGNDDYVDVPGLSDTLNDTASLAFWIRTTQAGNDTGWVAPGIAGVEQNGGTNDIFWGWLDGSGRIGVSVGNDYSTKSQSAINSGQWRHVVLIRDVAQAEYRIYIDGSLDASGAISAADVTTAYSSIGRIEDTGGTPEYFAGELDEVRIYGGALTDAEVTAVYNATHPCGDAICSIGNAVPGLLGEYFNNQTLSGGPEATRVDGPIDFFWDFGQGPAPLANRDDDFSIRWTGKLYVTQSANYRFRTRSDDGVRLWVDGDLVIERWNDHAVQTDTSGNVSLEAGGAYDVTMEFYENGGVAEIELLWARIGGGPPNYQLIPPGNSEGTAAGLYHCQVNQVATYTLEHSLSGVTCEAEPVQITARDSAGNAVAPSAGTEIILGVDPADANASWVGGNSYIFGGTETGVVRYLSQTTPATLVPEVAEVNGDASGRSPEAIVFSDVGLRFYGNRAGDPIPHQIAGETDLDPVVRVVRTDDSTGTCLNVLAGETRSVDLAYECRDPAVCVQSPAQTLTLDDNAIAANDQAQPLTFTATDLAFDAEGFASVPFEFSDVGQLRLHGQTLVEVENDPGREVLASGSSNEFVVKPYTLVVDAVRSGAGNPNPGSSASGAGFVAAGEPFTVVLEARNARGAVTPNFGNETTGESARLNWTSLIYPSGGDPGVLGGNASFTLLEGGRLQNDNVTWDNVGTLTLTPRLLDDDYLTAGDLPELTESDSIGRFHPFDYHLTGATVTDACGTFSYQHHAALNVAFTVQARNLFGAVVSNYDNVSLGYSGVAVPGYVAEDSDGGNGTNLSGRIQLLSDANWTGGVLEIQDPSAAFLRAANTRPDGPWDNLQWGLTLTDALDARPLVDLDMNANTSGDCVAAGNCSAVALGESLNLRYGRLHLEDAFGPEVIDLPVPFYTEFWNGSEFVRNVDDSCTRIPREAITYQPTGDLVDDSNRTVPIGGGSTTGQYADLDGVGVNFSSSDADHYFTAPGEGNTGSFDIGMDLTNRPWLRFDWNQDGDFLNDIQMPPANIGFGSYRGHDRIIYWREVLE